MFKRNTFCTLYFITFVFCTLYTSYELRVPYAPIYLKIHEDHSQPPSMAYAGAIAE